MISESLPRLAVVVLFGLLSVSTGCSSSPPGCPVCGTDINGTVGLIDVMAVPGHSASGAPGGPFNLFDISWVDPAQPPVLRGGYRRRRYCHRSIRSTTSRCLRSAGTVPSPNPEIMPACASRIRPEIKSFLPSPRRREITLSMDARPETFASPVSLVRTAISADLWAGYAAAHAAIIYSRCRVRMASKPRPMESSCLPAMAPRTWWFSTWPRRLQTRPPRPPSSPPS